MALGAAKKEAGRFYALLNITVPGTEESVTAKSFHTISQRQPVVCCGRRARSDAPLRAFVKP